MLLDSTYFFLTQITYLQPYVSPKSPHSIASAILPYAYYIKNIQLASELSPTIYEVVRSQTIVELSVFYYACLAYYGARTRSDNVIS